MGSESEPLPAAERWECAKKGRYYLACVQRNLFGDLEVWRAWGGIGSHRGGQQFDPVSDVDSARVRLAAIDRRRRARGYCWSTPRQCTDDSPCMAAFVNENSPVHRPRAAGGVGHSGDADQAVDGNAVGV